MKIVIVGSGNVGTVLCRAIKNAGHEIVQVVSRKLEHAAALASVHGTKAGLLTDAEFMAADLYILALNDAPLINPEKFIALKNKFVVHTAGSVSMNVLKNLTPVYGILYPLQTMSKVTGHVPEMPLLVEADSPETLQNLVDFAKTISNTVIPSTESERMHYHIAAVFAGNFTNHMYAIAENYCNHEKIDFKNLIPLIKEITSRLDHFSPREVQTGPAVREDIITINKHLQALSSHTDPKYLYLKLSESILKLHEKRL